MRDKNGRRLGKQHMPKPKWPGPYETPTVIAGFRLIRYLGFVKTTPESKAHHEYEVVCTVCGETMIRWQSSLSKAEDTGQIGCSSCANAYYKRSLRDLRTEENIAWAEMCKEWKNFLFTMPVTSIRARYESGRCFDSEKTKVMGWHTI